MTFVSYAQNFEDVMLWRALKHVKNGLYVDVGAQHPVNDSVSKAFYERGWRGVHIEPVPEYALLLRNHRPDETVLEVALTDTEGVIDFYVAPDTGLSTAVAAYAANIAYHQIQVRTSTLTSALAFLAGKEVHWLKIDVEGFEESVLKGWDSQILRPWILIVEATIPNSAEQNYSNWEPMVFAANYKFVYFDGLNRFYVAKEHAELVPAFSCPPNCFDDFEFSEHSLFCNTLKGIRGEQIELLTGMLKESETDRAARWTQIETLTKTLQELQADLQTLFARPGFRVLTRFSGWSEVDKLKNRIGKPNE